jgi:hypothetical protein
MDTTDKTDLLTKLASAALDLAADQPWQDIVLGDLCAASDASLSQCAHANVTKADVAAWCDGMLDQAMLDAITTIDRTQGVRDRLFDALMSRFDAMEENRAAWVSLILGEQQDGINSLARRARRLRTSAWALEASGVTASNLKGAGRAIGLARLLRLTETVWVTDDSDLAKTMARLDQELRKGEEWVMRATSLSAMFGR